MATDLRLALTMDVEPLPPEKSDSPADRDAPLERLLPFLDLTERYDVSATYFITHDYWDKIDVRFPHLVQRISENGEIGCHTHFRDERTYRTDFSFQRMLIGDATDALRSQGYNVRSFRGGAWFFITDTLRVLEELNYYVDSSIKPGYHAKPVRGLKIDYRRVTSLTPYLLSKNDPCLPGQSSVMEVPITIFPVLRFDTRKVAYCIGLPIDLGSILWKPSLALSKFQRLLEKVPRAIITMNFHSYDLLRFCLTDVGRFLEIAKSMNTTFYTLSEIQRVPVSTSEKSTRTAFTLSKFPRCITWVCNRSMFLCARVPKECSILV